MDILIKVRLLDQRSQTVAILEVDANKLEEASLVLYKGKLYRYAGLKKGFVAEFGETGPVLDLTPK